MLACCVLVAGLGVWALGGVSSFLDVGVTPWGLIAAIAVLAWGLMVLWLGVGPRSPIYGLSDRLYAGPAGVRTGPGGRDSYPWSEIAGFEAFPPKGSHPMAAMVLLDGRRIPLRPLRQVDDGMGTVTNEGEAEEALRQLRLMLDEARAREA